MYYFQSLGRNVDICGLPGEPVIKFHNYVFFTDDEKMAARIRKNSCFGREYWEDDPALIAQQDEVAPAAKRGRGRPPKTKVIDGARTASELQGE